MTTLCPHCDGVLPDETPSFESDYWPTTATDPGLEFSMGTGPTFVLSECSPPYRPGSWIVRTYVEDGHTVTEYMVVPDAVTSTGYVWTRA